MANATALRQHYEAAFEAANQSVEDAFWLATEVLSDLDEDDAFTCLAELQDRLARRHAAHPLD